MEYSYQYIGQTLNLLYSNKIDNKSINQSAILSLHLYWIVRRSMDDDGVLD